MWNSAVDARCSFTSQMLNPRVRPKTTSFVLSKANRTPKTYGHGGNQEAVKQAQEAMQEYHPHAKSLPALPRPSTVQALSKHDFFGKYHHSRMKKSQLCHQFGMPGTQLQIEVERKNDFKERKNKFEAKEKFGEMARFSLDGEPPCTTWNFDSEQEMHEWKRRLTSKSCIKTFCMIKRLDTLSSSVLDTMEKKDNATLKAFDFDNTTSCPTEFTNNGVELENYQTFWKLVLNREASALRRLLFGKPSTWKKNSVLTESGCDHEMKDYCRFEFAHFLNSIAANDVHGVTALMVSARNVHYECVKVLIDAGADPCCTNANKDTALHFLLRAAAKCSTPRQNIGRGSKCKRKVFCDIASRVLHILKVLMRNGAPTDANVFGECPQHYICKLPTCRCRESCSVKVLKALLEFDSKDEIKKSFSLSISNGSLPKDMLSKTLCSSRYDAKDTRPGAHNMSNQLSRLDAALRQRDREGFTALDYAIQIQNRDLVAYLQNARQIWGTSRSLQEAREDKDMLWHLQNTRKQKNTKATSVLNFLEKDTRKHSLFCKDENGERSLKTLGHLDDELAFSLRT